LINYRDEYGGGKWKHPFIGSDDQAAIDQLEEIGRDRFLVGSPDTVNEKLKRFVDFFSVDHLICRLYFPGMPHEFIINELHLLAKEVMPEFK
jgi:alkanesulfonate monooxygenase SsuD/methylene tetrahydromethanopterin reductase-like flavin-dependent oxidoreductase (luciferase family)